MLIVQLIHIVQFHSQLLRPSPVLQTLHAELRLNRNTTFFIIVIIISFFYRRNSDHKCKKTALEELNLFHAS